MSTNKQNAKFEFAGKATSADGKRSLRTSDTFATAKHVVLLKEIKTGNVIAVSEETARLKLAETTTLTTTPADDWAAVQWVKTNTKYGPGIEGICWGTKFFIGSSAYAQQKGTYFTKANGVLKFSKFTSFDDAKAYLFTLWPEFKV